MRDILALLLELFGLELVFLRDEESVFHDHMSFGSLGNASACITALVERHIFSWLSEDESVDAVVCLTALIVDDILLERGIPRLTPRNIALGEPQNDSFGYFLVDIDCLLLGRGSAGSD